MSSISYEVNFDGLAGPTHCYAGLSIGNVPSLMHAKEISNPQQAALQGLEKMRMLHQMGIKQGILPPQERPHIPTLKKLGFKGTNESILNQLSGPDSWILPQVSSSASMWAANAATVSPSLDSNDRHVHITPANLATYFHRTIEKETTALILKKIFPNPIFFTHHAPLPNSHLFLDEGSANHIRFCKNHQSNGVQLFIYGKSALSSNFPNPVPKIFPARQTKEASEALIRLHQLFPDRIVLAQQNPDAIDQGIFHNDVISFGNQNFFITHEKAFWQQEKVIEELKKKVAEVCDTELHIIQIKENEISLKEATETYFFNSQLVTLPSGSMGLIAPLQCRQNEKIYQFLNQLSSENDNPIESVTYSDLTQSLQNGGGPACLRLRIVLNANEFSEINPSTLFSETLYIKLKELIQKKYPTHLSIEDLQSPDLYRLQSSILDELTFLLNLGSIYAFQR